MPMPDGLHVHPASAFCFALFQVASIIRAPSPDILSEAAADDDGGVLRQIGDAVRAKLCRDISGVDGDALLCEWCQCAWASFIPPRPFTFQIADA
jgi:hypothetical protein